MNAIVSELTLSYKQFVLSSFRSSVLNILHEQLDVGQCLPCCINLLWRCHAEVERWTNVSMSLFRSISGVDQQYKNLLLMACDNSKTQLNASFNSHWQQSRAIELWLGCGDGSSPRKSKKGRFRRTSPFDFLYRIVKQLLTIWKSAEARLDRMSYSKPWSYMLLRYNQIWSWIRSCQGYNTLYGCSNLEQEMLFSTRELNKREHKRKLCSQRLSRMLEALPNY